MKELVQDQNVTTSWIVSGSVWLYAAPILTLTGFSENILSVAVLRRSKFDGMPSRHTLILLSICDVLVLILGTGRFWYGSMFQKYPQELSDWHCRIVTYIVFLFSHSSTMLIALVSIERMIAVAGPHSWRRWAFHIDRIGGPLGIAAICLIDSHTLFTTGLWPNMKLCQSNDSSESNSSITLPFKNLSDCLECSNYSHTTAVWIDVIDMIQLFVMPFIIVLLCNISIICCMHKSTRRLSRSASIGKNATLPSPILLDVLKSSSRQNVQDFQNVGRVSFEQVPRAQGLSLRRTTFCLDKGYSTKLLPSPGCNRKRMSLQANGIPWSRKSTSIQPFIEQPPVLDPIGSRRCSINSKEKPLLQVRQNLNVKTHRRSRSGFNRSRDIRVTYTLLMITTLFLICNFPFAVIHLMRTILDEDYNSYWDTAWLCTYLLVYLNNCLNFPVYMISQPAFREELYRMFHLTKKPINQDR